MSARRFWSPRLVTRLALAFGLIAALPLMVVPLVIQAVSDSFDRTFARDLDEATKLVRNELDRMKADVEALKRYRRPILCTEYMARPAGSRFDPILAYLKKEGVGAYNWGFVDGKSQTIYPWDSWQKRYDGEPPVWFHDIFRTDGAPYDRKEVEYIRSVTGVKKTKD